MTSQWKDRYETCYQEKQELIEQLKLLQARLHSISTQNNISNIGNNNNNPNNSRDNLNYNNGNINDPFNQLNGLPHESFSLERAYIQLKEEYKVSFILFNYSLIY